MKYEIPINVNERVKVKLTKLGEEVYQKQYDAMNEILVGMGARPLEPIDLASDEKGYVEFQIWDLMKIFGEFMYLGAPPMFESNLIYLFEYDEEQHIAKLRAGE